MQNLIGETELSFIHTIIKSHSLYILSSLSQSDFSYTSNTLALFFAKCYKFKSLFNFNNFCVHLVKIIVYSYKNNPLYRDTLIVCEWYSWNHNSTQYSPAVPCCPFMLS